MSRLFSGSASATPESTDSATPATPPLEVTLPKTSLSEKVCYYGSEATLPEQFELRSGPLTLLFEAGDLRYIRLDEFEVLRRLYWTVRDRNWGTPPLTLMNVLIESTPATFTIGYDAVCQQDEIDFRARVTISGDATGQIVFKLEGEAHSTFYRNRLGFCVLHPANLAGASCLIEHVGGMQTEANLPGTIRADQPVVPFAELSALTHEITHGAWAEVRFEGDVFEMEDQRNWTDASFKTFCTPLRLPYPVEVPKGSKISQTVTLRVLDQRPKARDRKLDLSEAEASIVQFKLQPDLPRKRLPALGLGVASHGQPLSEQAFTRLKALNLAHLRVDIQPGAADWEACLQLACTQAKAFNIPLEIALLLTDVADSELMMVRAALDEYQPDVCRWLIYPARERLGQPSVRPEWLALARKHLAAYRPNAPFAAGTNADFIFLNRVPPTIPPPPSKDASFDLLTVSINPQVHAFDIVSIVETIEAQATLVESARQLGGNRPVIVSPITLKPRHNPYATAEAQPPPADQLPPPVDVRQMSLFCAGWTLGSIKSMTESNTTSVTYYETTGWRGIIETEAGSPLPQAFRSIPGGVYPVYHIFADIAGYRQGEIVPTKSSNNLAVDGLALVDGERVWVIVANLTGESQMVRIGNLPGQKIRIRLLDEIDAEFAMRSPESYRIRKGDEREIVNGEFRLELLPFGLVRIEASQGELPPEKSEEPEEEELTEDEIFELAKQYLKEKS